MVKPDKFQQRIIEEFTTTSNNIAVQAVAGSGKTTLLLQLFQHIPKNKTAIYIAFNRHVVDSLKNRYSAKNLTISTFNSFGARMLYKAFGKISIVENKYFLIALKLFKNKWKLKENKWSYCYNVSKIVDVMRFNYCFDDDEAILNSCSEYGLLIMGDELVHAREAFDIGFENINQIDFLDQIFMCVTRKIRTTKFDFVLVDEFQDTPKLQHQFVKKLLAPGGRLVIVGDRNQSIYFFAGASQNSFDAMLKMVPRMQELPLSYCYRCGKAMVKKAQELVPQIQSHPRAIPGKIWATDNYKLIKTGDVVLCRVTRPLILLCRELIRLGRKAVIKGREVGENLIVLIRKTKAHNIEKCLQKIGEYETDLRLKLLKRGVYKPDQHKQMLTLIEKKEIIKILGEQVGTLEKLIKRIREIFTDGDEDDGILLSTAHKAKGLEWERVWFLNSFLIPSPYAVSEEELRQEQNILYVILTRAKMELIYINIFQNEEEELIALGELEV